MRKAYCPITNETAFRPPYPDHNSHHRNQIYKSCFPIIDYFLNYIYCYREELSCPSGTVNNAVQRG